AAQTTNRVCSGRWFVEADHGCWQRHQSLGPFFSACDLPALPGGGLARVPSDAT
ncbi:unnamed protein product, partial [Amoebophrya sp. A25]